jgi:hypothetical protein
MSPDEEEQARRVAERFEEAYDRPKNMVPVWNKDKERTVYVLPDTLKEEGGTYERLPANQLDSHGKPAPIYHPGQPQLPRKPKKPHKPHIYRTPPPAPIHPPIPPIDRERLPPRKPRPVKPVKPPKVPRPPKPQKHKVVRKYLKADNASPETVLRKFLARIQFPGV